MKSSRLAFCSSNNCFLLASWCPSASPLFLYWQNRGWVVVVSLLSSVTHSVPFSWARSSSVIFFYYFSRGCGRGVIMTVPAETTLCPGDKAGGCESALGAPASVITAISCVPSLLLSTSVLYAHLRTSDAGSGARTIVTCIAAADVLASLGYMVGSVNYRTHQESLGYTPDCYERFLPLCQIQSFVTCMGVMMSLLWTAILAIQVHQSVVKGRVYLERRAMLLCHVVGWGAPTIVSFSLLVGEELGYSTVTAPSWCYVADVDKDYVSPKPKWRITLMAFVGGVFVELCAYVVVIVCTALVACRREVSGRGT